KWLRGPGKEHPTKGWIDSMLLNPKVNKLCCLGFEAIRCGYTEKEICGVTTPSELSVRGGVKKAFSWLIEKPGLDSELAYVLASINDADVGKDIWIAGIAGATTIKSETHREQLITEYFAKGGIKVEFIN